MLIGSCAIKIMAISFDNNGIPAIRLAFQEIASKEQQ